MQRPLDPQQGFSGNVPFLNHDKWRRRRLPHYDAGGIYQMITYRLADALPKDVVTRLVERYGEDFDELLKTNEEDTARIAASPDLSSSTARIAALANDEKRYRALRQYVESVMDKGLGSCMLSRPDFAAKVIEAWRYYDGQRYEIIAFVIMPNHVHLLIRVFSGWKLGKLVWSWKNRVSHFARSQGIRLSEANSVWQREYWDRFIRDEKHYHAAIAYILDNPISAGLCAHREEWPWSSRIES